MTASPRNISFSVQHVLGEFGPLVDMKLNGGIKPCLG